jgi:vancomycin resistance protein YoaR
VRALRVTTTAVGNLPGAADVRAVATLAALGAGPRSAARSPPISTRWPTTWGDLHLMAARRTALVGAIGLAALLGLLLLALAVLWTVQRGAVLPNTTVAGVDVSGRSEDEVRETLAPTVTGREADPVTFTFEDETFSVAPAEVGYRVDVDATVEQALRRGRTGLPGDVVERVRSLRTARDLDLVERVDDEQLAAWVAGVAEEVDRDRSPGRVEADPDTLEVEVDLPHGSAVVRQDETLTTLSDAIRREGPDELELPVSTTPANVPDEDVEEAASQLRRALEGPLTLRASGTSLTLEPATIARLAEVVERPIRPDDEDGSGGLATVELVVTADRLEDELGDAVDRFDRAPQDARYTVSRAPPTSFDDPGSTTFRPVDASVGIEPAVDGSRFEPVTAATQITELLRQGAREAELRVEVVEPELTTSRAESLRPTHLLGTFTTYYQAGQTRNANIQRLADVIDGALVLPGEQFSINGISGERRCDKGYEPAGTIVRGELVDTCGGGVSQFGTTTFNAAFFAGVQLDQWKAHSWYISRYPMGREATLSYPELDVRFTNTTDAAIVVKTAHSNTSVTVSIYGQPIATAVSATHGEPTNPTQPSTQTRTTDELRCGQEREVQGQTDGFTVEVVRTVDRTDGSTDTRTIRTVYTPQNRIIERGAC